MPAQTLPLDIIYQRHGMDNIKPGRHTETDCGGGRSADFQAAGGDNNVSPLTERPWGLCWPPCTERPSGRSQSNCGKEEESFEFCLERRANGQPLHDSYKPPDALLHHNPQLPA